LVERRPAVVAGEHAAELVEGAHDRVQAAPADDVLVVGQVELVRDALADPHVELC
jgi:hypothetical protein